MLQHDKPEDFVIATGTSHSVRELLELAFKRVNLNWRDHVVTDQKLLRPAEVEHLRGNYSKAKRLLGWEPTISFEELVNMMVDSDLKIVSEALRA
jgi:GDPmannose 4,6-dehydratase